MKNREKAIYKRIVRIMTTPNRFNESHNRYEYYLENETLFLFPESGKLLGTKSGTIFRNSEQCWKLLPDLENLLKEVEKD